MGKTRNAIAGILFSLFLSGNAWPSSFTTEITDFWWDANESGWGINVTLQNDVAFATFFVYDTNQNSVWYSTALAWQGNFVWSGNLQANRGPWFGGPFNPNNVTSRAAGAARFALVDGTHATLTYTVDGVPVTKNLTRTTWKNEDFSGTYAGGYSIRASGCIPSSLNGIQEKIGLLSVNQSGSNVSMTASTPGLNCSFSGTYLQTGKLGQVDGSYSCTDGTHGTFLAYEMTPTISGFTARVRGQNQFCSQWSGYFGGLARAEYGVPYQGQDRASDFVPDSLGP